MVKGGIDDVEIQKVEKQNDFFVKTKLMNTGSERIQDKVTSIIKSCHAGKEASR